MSVRLLNEVEQLLVEQNLDLTRNSEQLKSIRRGEWSLDKLEDYFARKEADLESTYSNSQLPDAPNVSAIRNLLFNCLEQHFGSMAEAVTPTSTSDDVLREIKAVLKRYDI